MKFVIVVLAMLIVGCDQLPPPTDAAIQSVAKNCESKGMVVDVFYNGAKVELECLVPPPSNTVVNTPSL